MTRVELNKAIDKAYELIEARIDLQKKRYEEKNISVKRISFEDVSLDDILENVLLPLLPELIDKYSGLELNYRFKSYRVYIGTLCEIVKNGLVNGGILKTMDARIGDFDRNHHYALIKDALRFEGIEIIEKHRKYEETIINEAGIPHGYHKKCLELFKLYWKWLHNYDVSERESFLRSYLNFETFDKVYIIDPADLQRLDELRQETQSFSEKVIKTCLKFERVFTAIDAYPEAISGENIEEVAEIISSNVGFDFFSVVRSSAVKQYILDYARKVSFTKFAHIKMNLPDSEAIILPNGKTRKNNEYLFPNILGGIHRIRGNAYEVSFPIALSVEDYYRIDLQTPLIYGNSIVYTSDEPIEAEIDGYERRYRTFCDPRLGILYVFYERIAPGTSVYIDGNPIRTLDPFSVKTYICKYWDVREKHYKLALCINSLKYASSKDSMRRVSLTCNGVEIIHGQTNRNGFFRISDKLFPLEEVGLSGNLRFEFFVNSLVVQQWITEVSDFYIWGKKNGLRIYEEIDLSRWHGSSSVIVFSKEKVNNASFVLDFVYSEQGYYVYEGEFNKESDEIYILDKKITINKPNKSYIELISEYDINSEKICVDENVILAIKVHNLDENDNTQILQIEHDNEIKSYNLRNLSVSDLENVCALLPLRGKKYSYVGGWNIILFKNNQRISDLEVMVLPQISITSTKAYYEEGEEVIVDVCASADCFEQEGEYVNTKRMRIGNAKVVIDGNLVRPHPIEFDCFIDKCNVVLGLTFIPDVWGLRMRDQTSDTWLNSPLTSLTIEELEQYIVFVCSTKEMSISVSSGNDEMKRLIHPGYNKMNLKSMLCNYGSKTDITFTDSYGKVKTISVICPTKIIPEQLRYSLSEIVVPLKYYGPVNATLYIRAFSGREEILYLSKYVNQNFFRMSICIDRYRIKDPTITIEAKVGVQDYQRVLKTIVDFELLKEDYKDFQFTQELPIIKLLSILSILFRKISFILNRHSIRVSVTMV